MQDVAGLSSGPTERGREVFFRAGAELLSEEVADVAMRALTVRAVTKRAERSTGAFYHYWETQEDFVRDLVGWVLEPAANLSGDPIVAAADTAMGPPTSDLDALISLFEYACREQTDDPRFRCQMLLWALGGDDSLAGLRELYRSYQTIFEEHYERFLRSANMSVSGVSVDEFAVIVTAALDGIAIRRRIDPERAGPATARHLGEAIAARFLTARGPDSHDADR